MYRKFQFLYNTISKWVVFIIYDKLEEVILIYYNISWGINYKILPKDASELKSC